VFSHAAGFRRRALGAALAVTVLWSSSWVLIRAGLRQDRLPPLTFAGLRYVTAAAALWVAVALNRAARGQLAGLTRRSAGHLAVLGVVFYALTQGAQFAAIDAQPVATTSLFLTLTPLLVGLTSGRLLSERPGRAQAVGAMLVPAGAAAYFSGTLGTTPAGLAACAVALAANAGASLLGRGINRDTATAPLITTTVSMTIGAVTLLAAGAVTEGWPTLSGQAVAIIAWLAIINTAVAFTLWNFSLRHLTAGESSVVNNAMLPQIGLLGWVFLGEAPGPWQWAGMLLVAAGVVIGQHRHRPTEHAAADRPDMPQYPSPEMREQ
jgi:drug/metabolite transporter (DMT)-like permease